MGRLTNEELQEIRERTEKAKYGNPLSDIDALIRKDEVIHEDIPKLLEEIKTLRNELSTICPIGDLDVISTLKTEKQYMMRVIAEKDEEIERLREIIECAYKSLKKEAIRND